ncbi:hypothetical protein MNBD_BACTEROID02-1421, partial [hydrothermal vent metagenome]
ASKALHFFLKSNNLSVPMEKSVLNTFSKLDDFDIISSIKNWCDHKDFVLSYLCNSIINRRLPKVQLQNDEFSETYIKNIKEKVKAKYNLKDDELAYLVFNGEVMNQAYSTQKEQINILYKNKEIRDIADASDNLSIEALSKLVKKHFICYPKNIEY